MGVTIPNWAVLIMGAVFLPWLIYLTKQGNDNAKDIAINTATDKFVADELKKLNEAIEKQNKDTKGMFDKLEQKLDLFMAQEVSLLKQITK